MAIADSETNIDVGLNGLADNDAGGVRLGREAHQACLPISYTAKLQYEQLNVANLRVNEAEDIIG